MVLFSIGEIVIKVHTSADPENFSVWGGGVRVIFKFAEGGGDRQRFGLPNFRKTFCGNIWYCGINSNYL